MTEEPALAADIDAEVAVLGAALQDEVALADVTDVLQAEDFYREDHRLIFATIDELTREGRSVDALTVRASLEASGRLSNVGGVASISRLTDYVPDVANAKEYASLVKEKSTRRSLAAIGRELSISSLPAAELLDRTLSDLLAHSGKADRDSSEVIGDAVERVARDAVDLASGHRDAVAIETGIQNIDEAIVIRPGEVVVIAGGTSSGKTSLATQIALHQSQAGKNVLMFSLEMGRDELAARVLAGETGIPINRITTGGMLTQNQQTSLTEASHTFKAVPLIVNDSVDLTVVDLRACARRQQVRAGLDFLVIDYLQLITPATRGRSREQEVGEISRGIKLMARSIKVPILLLSQLSRRHQEEKRAPQLRDLRESGAIENDADIVLMLHRPNLNEPHAELLIRKQRQGPLGKVRLGFDGPTTRFGPEETVNGW